MNNQIYCALRKEWVKAQPEEIVRQRVLKYLIDELRFPLSSIVVEKGLRQMPHLSLTGQKIPRRRADILCFSKEIHPDYELHPLLLIECKAIKLTSRMINQVIGYNYYLKARFLALVNDEEIRFGWFDPNKKEYAFIDYFPSYESLILPQVIE